MNSSLTVLVSAAGSPSMPGMIDCLKNNGERFIRIIGMDMCDEPSVKFLVDKFYKVPAAIDENYIDIVLNICKNENVNVYFPNISSEVGAVATKKNDFENVGTIVSISNQESIDIANNKFKAYQFLKSKGIKIPQYFGVHSLEDFIKGCKLLGYPQKPVCLKIVDGSGGRGVRIIDKNRNRYQMFVSEKPNSFFTSYDDMIEILKEADEFHEMMLVEYMPGNEYTVDLLADKGKVLYMVGRENVVSLMSIAQESLVLKIDSAYSTSAAIVDSLKMDGNVGFDFMKDADGSPVLMDINPRVTATVSVIAAAGVNLPYLRIKQLLGEALPENIVVRYGTKLKRRYGEIYTDPEGNRINIGC